MIVQAGTLTTFCRCLPNLAILPSDVTAATCRDHLTLTLGMAPLQLQDHPAVFTNHATLYSLYALHTAQGDARDE